MFEDERRCPAHRVFDDALQRDDVGAAAKILQDLDLALYLLLFDRLQRFHYAFLIVGHVDGFENLAVLAPAEFPEGENKLATHLHSVCPNRYICKTSTNLVSYNFTVGSVIQQLLINRINGLRINLLFFFKFWLITCVAGQWPPIVVWQQSHILLINVP